MLCLPQRIAARLERRVLADRDKRGRAAIAEVRTEQQPAHVEVRDDRRVLLREVEHVDVAAQADRIECGVAAEVAQT